MSLRVGDQQFNEALALLGDLVERHPVSGNPERMEPLQGVASLLQERFKKLDFSVTQEVIEGPTPSAPVLLAKKVYDVALPTVVFYAHYDVQPVNPTQWSTNPTKMERKGDTIYGRGVTDDLTSIVAIIIALEAYQAEGKTPSINIVVLFEGGGGDRFSRIRNFYEGASARVAKKCSLCGRWPQYCR